VAVHLDELSVKDEKNLRKFPISSGPEIFDNSLQAWFAQIINYDLALIKWLYKTAAELADKLGQKNEAEKWRNRLAEWPDFAIDQQEGFLFAPGIPYHESHRHFSQLMAFHPLGLVDWSNGERDQDIIKRTLFCLPHSFHVNGDPSGTGKSKFTYRPFTLEGNFAFASGVREMLLQSHTGVIHVFPAIPASWKNVSFDKLRAQGAFLVSAPRREGEVKEVKILSEKGGRLRIKMRQKIIELDTRPGQAIVLK